MCAQARAALTLWLADDDVGAILGRKGQNLVDIQQSARVTIKISDRSKMDPTTNEREVSIAGEEGGAGVCVCGGVMMAALGWAWWWGRW